MYKSYVMGCHQPILSLVSPTDHLTGVQNQPTYVPQISKRLVVVLAQHEQALFFRDEHEHHIPVRQAVSCLVKPQCDDLVEVVYGQGLWWVVSILERQGEQKNVQLISHFPMCIQAPTVTIDAPDRLVLQAATYENISKMHLVVSENRVGNIKHCDSEHVGSKMLTCRQYSAHSHVTMMTASSLIKIDAAQIHMG